MKRSKVTNEQIIQDPIQSSQNQIFKTSIFFSMSHYILWCTYICRKFEKPSTSILKTLKFPRRKYYNITYSIFLGNVKAF